MYQITFVLYMLTFLYKELLLGMTDENVLVIDLKAIKLTSQ